MFYVTHAQAVTFWAWYKGQIDDLQSQADNLKRKAEQMTSEKRKLELLIEEMALKGAIDAMKYYLPSFEELQRRELTLDSESVAVHNIGRFLERALTVNNHVFDAKESEHLRAVAAFLFRYTIKEAVPEEVNA